MDLNRMRQLAGVIPAREGLGESSMIGKTILQQMGGPGRLSAMLGAKNFVLLDNGVSFRWPNKERSRGNAVRITLNPDDTYDMEFMNVAGSAKTVKKYDSLQADQLVDIFERQTGWYLSLGGSKKPAGSGYKPGPEMPPIGTKHEALDELRTLLGLDEHCGCDGESEEEGEREFSWEQIEAVLEAEGTPDALRHCVAKVAKKNDGDVKKAFAICTAQLQKGGYMEPGSQKLTPAGKAKEKQHDADPDAPSKLAGYEKLLKGARKKEDIDETAAKTYAQAQQDALDSLEKKGWKVARGLKIPHATDPSGETRLWFKSQAVHVTSSKAQYPYHAGHSIGNARSLDVDLRKMDPSELAGHAERFFKPSTPASKSGAPSAHAPAKAPPAKAASEPQHRLSPDQYHQKHGQCPDGYSFDDGTKKCVKSESVRARMDALLTDGYKTGTIRQRKDGKYQKQADGTWAPMPAQGHAPAAKSKDNDDWASDMTASDILTKYDSGKLGTMTPDHEKAVVHHLSTAPMNVLSNDDEVNHSTLAQLKKDPEKNAAEIRDTEHMIKLYRAAMLKKGGGKSESNVAEVLRLAGVNRYPDRALTTGEMPETIEDLVRTVKKYVRGGHPEWNLGVGEDSEGETDEKYDSGADTWNPHDDKPDSAPQHRLKPAAAKPAAPADKNAALLKALKCPPGKEPKIIYGRPSCAPTAKA